MTRTLATLLLALAAVLALAVLILAGPRQTVHGSTCGGSFHPHPPDICHAHCRNAMNSHNLTHGSDCGARQPQSRATRRPPGSAPTPTPSVAAATRKPVQIQDPDPVETPAPTSEPTPRPTPTPAGRWLLATCTTERLEVGQQKECTWIGKWEPY